MPNNEAIPFYEDGDELTAYCTADVIGKRFAMVSADRRPGGPADGVTDATDGGNISAATATAGIKVLGVFGYDQAMGGLVPVFRYNRVMPVTAGASITAGQEVQSDGVGKAVPLIDSNGAKAAHTFGASTSTVRVVAAVEGQEGNFISIAFVDPGAVSHAHSVTVSGEEIIVTLATDSGSVITSTAAEIIALINATPAAEALVVADNGTTGVTTGAGLVTAHPEAELTGGQDTGYGRPAGLALASCASGDDAQISIYP